MRQPLLFLDQTASWGGAQRVLEVVLDALEREFVPLVALPEDGPFAAELRRRNIETLIFPLGCYRSGRKSMADMMVFVPRSLYCGFKFAQIIRQRNIRLVYINGPRCLVAGVVAAGVTRTPSLFHLHLAMTRRADLWVAARAARYATKIVACSQAAATALLSRNLGLSRALRVIYSPVRQSIASQALSPQGASSALPRVGSVHPRVGAVGRINPQRGQHVLLRAASRLKSRGRNIQMVFLGEPQANSAEDADYLRFLQSLARQLGLESTTEWPGYQADPNPYYAALDVLVVPTIDSESLSLVALEAMQWGVPVIGSRVGGIPEIVHEGVNGFLVPPGDDAALAESLERILSDGALRSRLGVGARATIDSRFSIETFNNSIRGVVSQLCQPGATPAKEPQRSKLEARV